MKHVLALVAGISLLGAACSETPAAKITAPSTVAGASASITASAQAATMLAVGESEECDARSGPRNLDSGLSEISIVF